MEMAIGSPEGEGVPGVTDVLGDAIFYFKPVVLGSDEYFPLGERILWREAK